MAERAGILVVEDDAAMREACLTVFAKDGFEAAGAATAVEALNRIVEAPPISIVVSDLKLPGMDGIELLKEIKKRDRSIEVVLMTGYGTIKSAVEAMKIGASDYLTKPFELEALLAVVRRLVRVRNLEGEVRRLRTELKDRFGFGSMVGGHPGMRDVFELTRAAAESDAPVIIEGESGTGKELVARAIHYDGLRSRGPFIPLNCSALPTELLESELFGHRRGAFTGAHSDTRGLFRAAEGGTIFLDEITEMPLGAQAKLLRVLEEKRVRPVGAVAREPVDVRVLAAANCGLAEAVKTGRMREDLYYRLSVIVIEIPPLRERASDIPLLATHFIQEFNKSASRPAEGFSPAAVDALCAYGWPGNVRELRNVIEGLYAVGRHGVIALEDLPRGVREPTGAAARVRPRAPVQTLQAAERQLVEAALRATKGNKSEAARLLAISRSRLYHFIRLYRIRL